ncbi:MAG: hypothetical protein H6727_20980 [Myxococcales bacterium]|nr:hypothetical protein [Myxococcales bacterium]
MLRALVVWGVLLGWCSIAQANDCKARCSGMTRICQNIEFCVQRCGLSGSWGQLCYRKGKLSYARCSTVYRTCYPRPRKEIMLGGSYRESCRKCVVRGKEMCCSCPNKAGQLKRSCVSVGCLNPVSNCDGKLLCSGRCDQLTLLSGPYERSCNKCLFYRRSMCCRCRTRRGKWKTSCLSSSCSEPVSNCDGQLTCSAKCAGSPTNAWQLRGTYRTTCHHCSQQKGQMCCRCRGAGSWMKYSCVSMSCSKRVQNCNGQLRCGGRCD